MTLPVSILFVSVQAIMLSLICLILYFALWKVSSRFKTTLLFSGLVAISVLWVLAIVPVPNLTESLSNWSETQSPNHVVDAETQLLNSPTTLVPLELEKATSPDTRPSEVPFSTTHFQMPPAQLDVEPSASPAHAQISSNCRFAILNGLKKMQSGAKTINEASSYHLVQWLLFAFIGLAIFGGLRFFIACASYLTHARQCIVLEDAQLEHTLSRIASKLDINTKISVYESSIIKSACTTGWLFPRIILPKSWRAWSESELAAVLAHETVHVANHDFARQLIGQIGIAVHFYNPLAHWMLKRLRLEQELAADQTAAALVGGTKVYISCLASLALAQDEKHDGRLSPMFLPTGKMLIQRVDRLRRQTNVKFNRTSAAARVATSLFTWLGITAVTLSLSAFQSPEVSPSAHFVAPAVSAVSDTPVAVKEISGVQSDSQPQARPAVVENRTETQEESSTQTKPTLAKIGFVPPNTLQMMIIRASRFVKNDATRDAWSEVFPKIDETLGLLLSRAKIDSSEVDQITMLFLPSGIKQPQIAKPLTEAAVIYTTTDIQARIKEITSDEPNPTHGLNYYRIATGNQEPEYFVCLVDDYTIVAGTKSGIQSALSSRNDKTFISRYDDWSKFAASTGLMFAADAQGNRHRVGTPEKKPIPFLAAYNAAQTHNQLDLVYFCDSHRDAKNRRVLLNAMKESMIPALAEVKKQEATLRSEPDWELFMILDQMYQSMTCTAQDNSCSASCKFATDSNWHLVFPAVLSKLFKPIDETPSRGQQNTGR